MQCNVGNIANELGHQLSLGLFYFLKLWGTGVGSDVVTFYRSGIAKATIVSTISVIYARTIFQKSNHKFTFAVLIVAISSWAEIIDTNSIKLDTVL